MRSLLVLIIYGCTANDSKAYWITTIFIIIVYDSVGRIVRQGMARMACLFSVRFGLSAEITQVPGGLQQLDSKQDFLFPYSISTCSSCWCSRQPSVCQSSVVAQGSKRGCSKRQEREDASLLKPGFRNCDSVTCVIYW